MKAAQEKDLQASEFKCKGTKKVLREASRTIDASNKSYNTT